MKVGILILLLATSSILVALVQYGEARRGEEDDYGTAVYDQTEDANEESNSENDEIMKTLERIVNDPETADDEPKKRRKPALTNPDGREEQKDPVSADVGSMTSTKKAISSNSSTASPITTSPVDNSSSSWTVFFILCVLACSILCIHILIEAKFHLLPESVAIVFLGAIIGLLFKLLSHYKIADWSKEESFQPTAFFFVLLPPIIFESGYNLHKGNFFQNIGSILVFAIFGTFITAITMGSGIYLSGKIHLTYALNARESFAFGSLVSAVDPVATLAIFNALDIDADLYMLVFGESILNDAVAIVLTNTIMALSDSSSFFYMMYYLVSNFCLMFFASAAIGTLFGIISALLFKFVDLRKTPSLETAFMLIFMYSPYVFAEATHLSGIMAILFAGIVMSHYTHFNLSPVTRITVQQVFRTLSFIAETCVFAYLGLAIFSFKHILKPSLVIAGIILCLASRACSIFPLAALLNYFREHKITKKMQFIMWFSGLRGAIAFALSLNLNIDNETRHIIVTSTLILVLFTTLVLGGSTMPMIKILNAEKSSGKRRPQAKRIFMSKTKELGEAVDLVNIFQDENSNKEGNDTNNNGQEEESAMSSVNIHIVRSGARLRGFARLDESFFKPLFIRKFTDEDLRDGQSYMNKLTRQWFDEVNTDAQPASSDAPRVYFKKNKEESENNNNKNSSKRSRTLDNKTYHHLNASSSNILLESTSDEDEDNQDEQVVIDKSQLLLKK